jgi:hypothetical protein
LELCVPAANNRTGTSRFLCMCDVAKRKVDSISRQENFQAHDTHFP